MAGTTRQKQAFLVCGTHSGCGKTTVTLGLLAALRARGLSAQPFKVGPDFIERGLHTRIAGRQSRDQAGGQANALRALIKSEQDRGPDFLRLANALSALYPTGGEEKRLLDAMLLAVPR